MRGETPPPRRVLSVFCARSRIRSVNRRRSAHSGASVPACYGGRARSDSYGGFLMIEARGLVKRYGPTIAVDHLSFDVRPGTVTGFLGPNGAGKSTTMRMMLGLDSRTPAGADQRAGLPRPAQARCARSARCSRPGRSTRDAPPALT